MCKKILLFSALAILLASAAGLIAQERWGNPARRARRPQNQLWAQNQYPSRMHPYRQQIRQNHMRQFRGRRRGAVEGLNRPFIGPHRPRRGLGWSQQPRGFQQQVAPQAQLPRLNQWFEQLKQAYKDNNREKMGQLIRRMEQFRNRARQALPQQTPQEVRPLPREQTNRERPSLNRDFEGQPLPRQQRFRQRGFQQDFQAPAIRPGLGTQEQENLPVTPRRQMRLRQARPNLNDRPLDEQQQPVPNTERSDFPWY